MNTVSTTNPDVRQYHKAERHESPPSPAFSLGNVVATPGALNLLEALNIHPVQLLERHARADWGDLCAEDREANQLALHQGGRLLSVYRVTPASPGTRVWIITEADRSVTTLLLPSEY